MKAAYSFLFFLAFLAVPAFGFTEELKTCLKDCLGEITCIQKVATCFIDNNDTQKAKKYLKDLVRKYPNKPELARLLSTVYIKENNPFWAEKALQNSLDRQKNDCITRSWLTWLYLNQGYLDLAEEMLAEPGCPVLDSEKTRWTLLQAYLAGLRENQNQQIKTLERMTLYHRILPEDKSFYKYLKRQSNPGWHEPLILKIKMDTGYTSNVTAQASTIKPDLEGEKSSTFMKANLYGQLIWPNNRTIRPAIDLNLKGRLLNELDSDDHGHKDNYLDVMVRPGFYVRNSLPRLFAGFRWDLFLLNIEDQYQKPPTIYHESYRGEVALETALGISFFAGGGKRFFRQDGRSRWEVDGGIGFSGRTTPRWRLLSALTARHLVARDEQYNKSGGSLLFVNRLDLGWDFSARLGLTMSYDHYPNSPTSKGGRDFFIKPSIIIWSPEYKNARIGGYYEFSRRESTAEVSFSFTEHLGGIQIAWHFSMDPWAPRSFKPANHIPLPYGSITDDRGIGTEEERIQDLLRQDEASRQGSSCVN